MTELRSQEARGQLRLGRIERSIKLYESMLDDDRLTPRNRACWEASLPARCWRPEIAHKPSPVAASWCQHSLLDS